MHLAGQLTRAAKPVRVYKPYLPDRLSSDLIGGAADEERLFRSFGDAFDGGQGSSSEGNLEALDERQAC